MQRTLAMRVYIAAYAVLLGVLTYLVLSVAGLVPQLAARKGDVSLAFVIVFSTIFGVLFVAVILAAAFWRDAPRRRWFWLGGAVPAVIFFGPDLTKIAGMIRQPAWAAFVGLLMLLALGTLIVAALASYRDARQPIS